MHAHHQCVGFKCAHTEVVPSSFGSALPLVIGSLGMLERRFRPGPFPRRAKIAAIWWLLPFPLFPSFSLKNSYNSSTLCPHELGFSAAHEPAALTRPDPLPMPRYLIVVPTDFERRLVAPLLAVHAPVDTAVELCGFGIAAAAARTSQLIAALRPERVILVGIAGRLDDRVAIGEAMLFDAVACYGIGAGTGRRFIPAGALGWPHWTGDPTDAASAVGDVLPCAALEQADLLHAPLLLTVAAAAADDEDVRLRKRLFPEASAEEMEGFAVALACRLANVPCQIVRGISNTAGDRDTANWKTKAALESAADLTLRLLKANR